MGPLERTGLSALAALTIAACGGGRHALKDAFSTDWQDDGGKSMGAVQQRLAATELSPGSAVAVGVTREGLVAKRLGDGERWEFSGKISGRPVVAGDLVLAPTGGRLVALEAKSGKRVWSVPIQGYRLRGAGDDGQLTVVSLAQGDANTSVLLGIGRGGDEVVRLASRQALGVPAAKGGVAFVPWQNQYVSAIDLLSGTETGRLVVRERVSHAVNVGGELYFGELGLLRFDDQVGLASRGGANRIGLPSQKLPGDPLWFGDGSVAPAADTSAYDRVRVYARPGDDDSEAGIDSSRYAATYYRVVLGLDANDGAVSWVHTLDSSALGGAAARGGFAVCTRGGQVTLLSAKDGGRAGQLELGQKLEGCVVSAGDFEIPKVKSGASLATQIGIALELEDTQMAAAQAFLLRKLGDSDDPQATSILIDLAGNPRTAPTLLEDTHELLAARRSGAKYMLAALAREYDFLSDVLRPPPVGPLADALSAMGEKRAAPLLARHLNDPANSPDDVKRAALALVKLATVSEFAELRTFFALYRATADSDDLVAATIAVAEAMLAVGGRNGYKIVARAANDPLTRPQIRSATSTLLAKAG